jgi:hypothetical protein
MSNRSLPHYRAFRRFAAPAQVQMQVLPKTLPAPLRGLILNENPAFMQPAAALELDNWFPTDNAIRLRGGSQKWTRLGVTGTPDNQPIRSMFNYIAGSNKKMFAANATTLYDVTAAGSFGIPVAPAAPNNVVITNGNFSTVTMATADGSTYLIAVNDAGEYALRFNGSTWQQLRPGATTPPSLITGPAGTPVVAGLGLTQVWKYRNRLFFIQGGTMNAWYLPVYAVGGALEQIPLSGAFTLGGSLLFGCAWSVSAGDGIDGQVHFRHDRRRDRDLYRHQPGRPGQLEPAGALSDHLAAGKETHGCAQAVTSLSQRWTASYRSVRRCRRTSRSWSSPPSRRTSIRCGCAK